MQVPFDEGEYLHVAGPPHCGGIFPIRTPPAGQMSDADMRYRFAEESQREVWSSGIC